MSERYLPIDEEGFFKFGERRVDDPTLGQKLLSAMRLAEQGRLTTTMDGEDIVIEAFDAPLVARSVTLSASGAGELTMPYGAKKTFDFGALSLDEWDRFHGLTTDGLPFVLSRHAQVEFFEMLDGFDDDSVTVKGKRYDVKPWLEPHDQVRDDLFWTNIYRQENQTPMFDLGEASSILPAVMPQLKLSKSRVLVLGCGNGHDAAAFARLGHAVTAVDFSADAIKNAQAKYGGIEGLNFVQHDLFRLPETWTGRFDLIFEHTCYCAISPDRRSDLVNVWRRMLHEQGYLLGIFYAHDKRHGPPWGGSEWEIRQRLGKHFDFMFWTRWRHSIERRKGRELVVYARRKNLDAG